MSITNDKHRVEIEIDGANNQSTVVLGHSLRGRWDWSRCKDPAAAQYFHEPPVPGQALGLELDTGRLYARDLLHEPAHEPVRKKLAKKFGIPKEYDEFGTAHIPTAVHKIREAVKFGLAKVVRGKIPEKLDPALGEPMLVPKRAGDEKLDALTDAITKMSSTLDKVLLALAKK